MKNPLLVYLLFLLFFFSPPRSCAQVINTICGNGVSGFSGDGGPAMAAVMTQPWGLARDAAGNIYFSDFNNKRVRKIAPSGIVTTFAGNGGTYSGDGGPATSAGINGPTGIVCFGTDVYISEVYSSRVRKVNAAGIITTFAGNGTPGWSGDDGPATIAHLSSPNGIGVDLAGNIYIPDQGSEHIRKVNTSGIITTIAGTGATGYTGDGGPATLATMNLPDLVTTDASGNVYFTDYNNNVVRKINTAGIISTFAGIGTPGFSGDGGPATSAQLNGPAGINFDVFGNCYITDATNNRIRMINPANTINTIAGNGTASYSGDGGPPLLAGLNNVIVSLADPAGNIYVGDMYNLRIRKITTVISNTPPSFTGGSSQSLTVCENDTATSINSVLEITDPNSSQTETWSLLSSALHGTAVTVCSTTSTGGTVTPSGLTYTPTPGYWGIDSFTVIVTDGIAGDTIKIYVTINPLPHAGIITGPAHICLGSAMTLSDTSGNGPGIWSSTNGHATIGPAGVVTGVTPGTDTIRYIVINLCGADTAIKIITIGNGLPSPGTITGPANVCLGSTITLSDMATGGSWSSASVNATINPSTGVLTGVAVGSALISYTIVTSCGTVAATKTINVNPLPPTGNITGIPNLCEGSSITLAGVLPGGKWSSGNPVVATIDSISGDVLALTPGNTVITYTTAPNTFGCINRTTFNITVHPAGTLVITDVTTPVKCNGEANGSIKATILGGSGSYQYLWSNGGTNQTIFNLAPGSYSVQVKDIVSNCTGTRTFNITEPGPLDITETITNEKCGTKNGSISLTVSGGIPPFKYVWSGPFTGTKIIGLPPDTYTVTVTDSNLCEKQIVAEVGADSCFTIHIHDVITPNGDGINDVWVIEGIHSYPENTVQVFDKFGDMVYSKQNYNNDWSGESSGGGHLPDGTYFYLVKLNASGLADEKNTITGSILIKQ